MKTIKFGDFKDFVIPIGRNDTEMTEMTRKRPVWNKLHVLVSGIAKITGIRHQTLQLLQC